jgi:hypothetical protein
MLKYDVVCGTTASYQSRKGEIVPIAVFVYQHPTPAKERAKKERRKRNRKARVVQRTIKADRCHLEVWVVIVRWKEV